MDWKYKHFHQARTFAAPRDEVADAARRVMSESLGWVVADTGDGFSAEGNSFAHVASAKFQFQPAGTGTKVDVDLRVQRAGATGFMLFDVGGYYHIQIRKWLDAIPLAIHQTASGTPQPAPALRPENKTGAKLFNGCLMISVAILFLWFFANFLSAIVGVLTGTLYLWGKGGTMVLHGLAARIVASLIILFGGFLAWRITKSGKTKRR
ncbi:MAG TPA: hypothetical protein VE961_02670 [Pyrinomonadaceae bacterium]|nr:hypothetical protein [Pyrinomonadaceae bacterium]